MVRRLFVDVESTGDGTKLWHSLVELHMRYYEDEELISEYSGFYGHNPKTLYTKGINYQKALNNTKAGHPTLEESLPDLITWLDTHLGNNKVFFIAYNCEWDYNLLLNVFKRNNIKRNYFWDPCICLLTLCACTFNKYLPMNQCASKIGIPVDTKQLHSAAYDVDVAVNIYSHISTKLAA